MSQWGNQNQANNAPKQKNISADSSLRGSGLFQNNVSIDGGKKTITLEGFATSDINSGMANPGWVLITIGTGGRAGRVQYETIACLGSINSINVSNASDFVNFF